MARCQHTASGTQAHARAFDRRRHLSQAARDRRCRQFRPGATYILTLPCPLTPQQLRATRDDVRHHIDSLLNEHTDAQVARILNEREMRTGGGDAFATESIKWVRYSAKIKSLKERYWRPDG